MTTKPFLLLGLLAFSSHAQLATGSAKFLGNITTNYAVRSDFLTNWNQITAENECKWGSIESTRDQMNWSGCDAVANFATQNQLPNKFHTLVWGSQYPSWMDNLSQEEQLEEITEWYDLVKERYPNLEMIDVVNEAIPSHAPAPFKNALGGDGSTGYDWIITSFRMARERWPNAILIYNDYNVLTWNTNEFLEIMNAIKGSGYVDAMGFQSHGLEARSGAELKGTLEMIYNQIGLPIFISEYDVNVEDDQEQLAVMQDQFPIFWQSEYVAGVTLWGYVEGATWIDFSGLTDGNGTDRPAFTWLKNYVKSNLSVASAIDWSTLGEPQFLSPENLSLLENSVEVSPLRTNLNNPVYSLTGGNDLAHFTLDGNQLLFVNAPDFENPLDQNSDNIYEVTVNALSGNNSLSQTFKVQVKDQNEGVQAPYSGTPISLPGRLEVEFYDLGGQDVSYYDSDEENQGGALRAEDFVDIAGSESSGYVIGWTAAGEWLEYTVQVAQTGNYQVSASVTSGADNGSLKILINGVEASEELAIPNTGDWNTYEIVEGPIVNLPEGQSILRLEITGSYGNIDWLHFEDPTVHKNQELQVQTNNSRTLEVFDLRGNKLTILKQGSETESSLRHTLKMQGFQGGVYLYKTPHSPSSQKIILP